MWRVEVCEEKGLINFFQTGFFFRFFFKKLFFLAMFIIRRFVLPNGTSWCKGVISGLKYVIYSRKFANIPEHILSSPNQTIVFFSYF